MSDAAAKVTKATGGKLKDRTYDSKASGGRHQRGLRQEFRSFSLSEDQTAPQLLPS